jgi:hypothetical protein
MQRPDPASSLARAMKALQANMDSVGPAVAASYTLIGAILLLGGVGYALDRRFETAPREDSVATMKQVVWMAAGCVGSWLVAAVLFDRTSELFLGMIGPLVAAAATWMAIERTQRHNPSGVTRLLMGALMAKVLFFGAYVVGVSRVPGIDLPTFAASFFVYFVALYIAQAFLIRGLGVPQAS